MLVSVRAAIASAKRFASRLALDQSGISLTEFAVVTPVLLTMGLYGAELARLAITRTQVSQIALSIADNASRLGQTDNSAVAPTVREAEVDAILAGALRQGRSIDLGDNGRIILSSLEFRQNGSRQWIHWQRCRGKKVEESDYGNDTNRNGYSGTRITGMGSGSSQATASSGNAVMFVEIYYEYEAMFDTPFGTGDRAFKQEAAFMVRDDRNLDPGLTGGSTQSSCTVYS